MGKVYPQEILERRRKEKEQKRLQNVAQNKRPFCRVVDIDSRRSFRKNREARRRIDSRNIRAEMKRNEETTVFEGSHITRLGGLPRSIRELNRFLSTLDKREQLKIERLVEDL